MKRIFFVVISSTLFLGSCRTPKDISYFQGVENLTPEQKEAMNQTHNPKICIDDILIINVTTPDRETAAPYNPPPYGFYKPGEAEIGISAETQNLYTYLVDERGYITFPVLGRVLIAGLTINEANRMMEDSLRESLPKALVNIQIANFKVGIIGEVARPNIYTVKSVRYSIFDLIAAAGNLNINADRKNVRLVRDNNGRKEIVALDLTDPAIFASPYYYLQQNDLIYVDPNEAQKRNSRYSNRDSYTSNIVFSTATAIFSAASTIVSIIALTKNK